MPHFVKSQGNSREPRRVHRIERMPKPAIHQVREQREAHERTTARRPLASVIVHRLGKFARALPKFAHAATLSRFC